MENGENNKLVVHVQFWFGATTHCSLNIYDEFNTCYCKFTTFTTCF